MASHDDYRLLYEALVASGAITKVDAHSYEALIAPDFSIFDDDERATLICIAEIAKKKGVQYLYDLSHEEKGFNDTGECDNISYEFARELKIG